MFISVTSNRFEIRTLRPAEGVEETLKWLSDVDVIRYMNARTRRHSRETVEEYILSHDNETTFILGIFDRQTGEYVGNHRVCCDRENLTCSLGALIGNRKYWGHGVLTETRAAILNLAFYRLEMFKAWAQVASRNIPVLASYRRLGFTCEGILRKQRLVDGFRMDIVQFGIMRDEWNGIY